MLGFTHVINLESGAYELFHEDTMERQDPKQFGITVLQRPCSDFWPPAKWRVFYIIEVVRYILPEKKFYIHCLTGRDRTGYVCAAYRMRVNEWTFKEAYREWVSLGRHWWYDWWKLALARLSLAKLSDDK